MTPSSPRTPRKTPTPAFPVDPSQHPPYQSQGVPPPAPGPPRRPPSRWRSRCRGDRGRGTRGQRLRGVRRGWGCRKERGRRPPRPPSSLGTAVMSPGHPQRSPSPAEGVPLPWGVWGGGGRMETPFLGSPLSPGPPPPLYPLPDPPPPLSPTPPRTSFPGTPHCWDPPLTLPPRSHPLHIPPHWFTPLRPDPSQHRRSPIRRPRSEQGVKRTPPAQLHPKAARPHSPPADPPGGAHPAPAPDCGSRSQCSTAGGGSERCWGLPPPPPPPGCPAHWGAYRTRSSGCALWERNTMGEVGGTLMVAPPPKNLTPPPSDSPQPNWGSAPTWRLRRLPRGGHSGGGGYRW